MILRSLLAVLLVALVAGPLLVAPRPAHAYSCAWNYGVEGNVERAELVVVGTVQEISGVGPLGYDLTISVEEYLKGSGDVTRTIWDDSLRTASGDSLLRAEGSPFVPEAVGKTYLLFLRSDQDHFRTDICTGSTEIDPDRMPTVVEEIRQIVAGTALATATAPAPVFPTTGAGTSESDGNRAWLMAGVAAAAAVGLAGVVAVAWRGAGGNSANRKYL